ncbi:MAG: hypothetical protein CMQ61_00600, partial [Gammaproteobacteria bacterium]|nr:hypothetical protein [Gammaproteobacteria bacterium]
MQIGVTIPTFQRAPALTQTLAHLATCTPGPHEVLIHIDAGDTDSAAAIAASPFADTASVIHASTRQGPGGGRNRLMAAANTPWVLSLDDDSYPLDKHFFTEAAAAIDAAPDAAVIATRITHQGELAPPQWHMQARPPTSSTVVHSSTYRLSAKPKATCRSHWLTAPRKSTWPCNCWMAGATSCGTT